VPRALEAYICSYAVSYEQEQAARSILRLRVLTGIQALGASERIQYSYSYKHAQAEGQCKRRVFIGTRTVIEVHTGIVDARMQASRPVDTVECSKALEAYRCSYSCAYDQEQAMRTTIVVCVCDLSLYL
jgi:hypothetical protein